MDNLIHSDRHGLRSHKRIYCAANKSVLGFICLKIAVVIIDAPHSSLKAIMTTSQSFMGRVFTAWRSVASKTTAWVILSLNQLEILFGLPIDHDYSCPNSVISVREKRRSFPFLRSYMFMLIYIKKRLLILLGIDNRCSPIFREIAPKWWSSRLYPKT